MKYLFFGQFTNSNLYLDRSLNEDANLYVMIIKIYNIVDFPQKSESTFRVKFNLFLVVTISH